MVDPFDGPEIATLAVAVVGALGGLAAAWIANKGRQHSRVVREQVENDHHDSANPNLRVNLDANEEAAKERSRRVEKKVDRVLTKVAHIENDVGFLQDGFRANRSRIQQLEDTEPNRQEQLWGPPRSRREWRGRHDHP